MNKIRCWLAYIIMPRGIRYIFSKALQMEFERLKHEIEDILSDMNNNNI